MSDVVSMDEDLVNAKVDIIEQNLRELEELGGMMKDEFTSSFRDLQAAKHMLQEAVEAALDLAYHVIASRGYRRPEDYKEAFTVLEENGVVDHDFAERLQDMAGFRNLLVHRYGEVDAAKVYAIMHDDVSDIRRFADTVLRELQATDAD
jgi:uncharacterized protein YutE (UPF0331/DUF86 family)